MDNLRILTYPDTPFTFTRKVVVTMGFVLLVLFFILTCTASTWWLLPLGMVILSDSLGWIAVSVVVVLAITVALPWLWLLIPVVLLCDDF